MRVLAIKCDRCPAHVLLEPDADPKALPEKWVAVFEKDLCPECSTALATFLQPLAQAATSA